MTTKETYEQIASIISKVRGSIIGGQSAEYTVDRIMRELAELFIQQNSRFNIDKFIEECK